MDPINGGGSLRSTILMQTRIRGGSNESQNNYASNFVRSQQSISQQQKEEETVVDHHHQEIPIGTPTHQISPAGTVAESMYPIQVPMNGNRATGFRMPMPMNAGHSSRATANFIPNQPVFGASALPYANVFNSKLMQPVNSPMLAPAPATAYTSTENGEFHANPPICTRSDAYEKLAKTNDVPEQKDLCSEFLPFANPASFKVPCTNAVLRITNCPFDVTKNEILAMLGLDAKVFEFGGTGSGFYAIHVMYERNTGKSGDVFVEFAAEEEKRITWDKFHSYAKRNGKPRMVGTRKVGLQDSWQGELMAMLFPRGKCLGWKGQSPVITVPVPGMSPFDGFVSDEELQNVLSHASKPGKGDFSKNSAQRPYESTITLLEKYPWHCTELISLRERDRIFNFTLEMVCELTRQVTQYANTDSPHSLKLTKKLLHELVFVAGNCTTFTRRQVRQLVIATEGPFQVKYKYPRLSKWLPFDVLDVIPGCSESLLEYYAICIREAAKAGVPNLPDHGPFDYPFAGFQVEYRVNKAMLSLKDVAQHERNKLFNLLCKLVWQARTNPGSVSLPSYSTDPLPFAD